MGDRAQVVRNLLEEFWASNWGVIERFAEDAVLEDPMLPEPVRGKTEILATFKFCHEWAHLRPEIKSVVADDHLAAAEFVVKGTVRTPLDGYGEAAVGAEFAFGETDVFEFDTKGLVRRMSIYADVSGFNRQLEIYVGRKSDPKECVQRNISAFNRKDVEGVVETYTEDCELVDMSQPEPVFGHGFLREYAAHMYEAFPDVHLENVRMFSEGNVVAVQMELVGTHVGEFLGYAGTGNTIRWRSASFFEMTESLDRIRKETYYYDKGRLIAQLEGGALTSS